MNHFTSPSFWECYEKLPSKIRELADKNFELVKQNPLHPSLHFKKINHYYSVRVGIRYRSLGVEINEGILWFWIGTHSEYDNLIRQIIMLLSKIMKLSICEIFIFSLFFLPFRRVVYTADPSFFCQFIKPVYRPMCQLIACLFNIYNFSVKSFSECY